MADGLGIASLSAELKALTDHNMKKRSDPELPHFPPFDTSAISQLRSVPKALLCVQWYAQAAARVFNSGGLPSPFVIKATSLISNHSEEIVRSLPIFGSLSSRVLSTGLSCPFVSFLQFDIVDKGENPTVVPSAANIDFSNVRSRLISRLTSFFKYQNITTSEEYQLLVFGEVSLSERFESALKLIPDSVHLELFKQGYDMGFFVGFGNYINCLSRFSENDGRQQTGYCLTVVCFLTRAISHLVKSLNMDPYMCDWILFLLSLIKFLNGRVPDFGFGKQSSIFKLISVIEEDRGRFSLNENFDEWPAWMTLINMYPSFMRVKIDEIYECFKKE